MTLLQLSNLQLASLGAILGLIMGSFISMLSWRLPRIQHLSFETQLKQLSLSRSHCPNCQHTLYWYQLFPLFSWLGSKAKCPHCGNPISIRYPLIELSSALLSALVVYQFGAHLLTLSALLLCWGLLTITIIDLEHQLILDALSLPLLWLGLVFNTQATWTSPENAIIGAALGYTLLWILFHSFKWTTGKEGMGFGDFKLLAALGAWFGALAISQIILIAALSSIVISLTLFALKQKNLQDPIPFGPYLALGGLSVLFFGDQLIQKIL